jgi:hypothetical protein
MRNLLPLTFLALACASQGPSLTQLPVGNASCPFGGVEISGSPAQYICNGPPGPSGASSTTTVVDLPAGDICPYGGVSIEEYSGATLVSTNNVCNGNSIPPCTTLNGSVTLNNDIDVEIFNAAGCSEVTGDVTVTNGVAMLRFPNLVKIGGGLTVSGSPGTLVDLELPNLQTVGQLVDLQANLSTLDLHSLVSVSALTVEGTSLTTLSLPALVGCAQLIVGGNNLLTLVYAPLVTGLSVLNISDNPDLPDCEVTEIRAANVEVGEFYDTGNEQTDGGACPAT